MGLLDREVQLKDAEFTQNQQTFTLWDGEYLGMAKSADYGDQPKARVTAGPDKDTFIVFGVKAEQIGRTESGELPMEVKIGRDGRAEPFVKG
jgi:hypothetical protein